MRFRIPGFAGMSGCGGASTQRECVLDLPQSTNSKEDFPMNNARVTGLRSIELGVTDLTQSAAFYSAVWGLEPVVAESDTIHLRANGPEHHAVTLRERPTAGMLSVHFAAITREAVDAMHAKAKAQVVKVTKAPADLPKSAGGGYAFQLTTPEGHVLNISADVARH